MVNTSIKLNTPCTIYIVFDCMKPYITVDFASMQSNSSLISLSCRLNVFSDPVRDSTASFRNAICTRYETFPVQ